MNEPKTEKDVIGLIQRLFDQMAPKMLENYFRDKYGMEVFEKPTPMWPPSEFYTDRDKYGD